MAGTSRFARALRHRSLSPNTRTTSQTASSFRQGQAVFFPGLAITKGRNSPIPSSGCDLAPPIAVRLFIRGRACRCRNSRNRSLSPLRLRLSLWGAGHPGVPTRAPKWRWLCGGERWGLMSHAPPFFLSWSATRRPGSSAVGARISPGNCRTARLASGSPSCTGRRHRRSCRRSRDHIRSGRYSELSRRHKFPSRSCRPEPFYRPRFEPEGEATSLLSLWSASENRQAPRVRRQATGQF